jgi:AcrR family transcriptional regulator
MAIDQKQILRTAFELLDDEGLDGLTIRQLAKRLGVQAPTLYWHFEGRRALLDLMADAMLSPVARQLDPDADWKDALRQVASEIRAALKARRDGARLFAGTYPISENVLRVGEAVIATLKQGGVKPVQAGWATFTLIYYVIGFVIEEQSVDPQGASSVSLSDLRDRATGDALGDHPGIVEALPGLLDEDFDGRFAFGLDLFVRGLVSRLAEEGAAPTA